MWNALNTYQSNREQTTAHSLLTVKQRSLLITNFSFLYKGLCCIYQILSHTVFGTLQATWRCCGCCSCLSNVFSPSCCWLTEFSLVTGLPQMFPWPPIWKHIIHHHRSTIPSEIPVFFQYHTLIYQCTIYYSVSPSFNYKYNFLLTIMVDWICYYFSVNP